VHNSRRILGASDRLNDSDEALILILARFAIIRAVAIRVASIVLVVVIVSASTTAIAAAGGLVGLILTARL
jgi:hypothetical protein